MRTRCDCYACRVYFDGCEERKHPNRIRAKHLRGTFWWGSNLDSRLGRVVKICRPCKVALAQG